VPSAACGQYTPSCHFFKKVCEDTASFGEKDLNREIFWIAQALVVLFLYVSVETLVRRLLDLTLYNQESLWVYGLVSYYRTATGTAHYKASLEV
jgi:hypothetical protein